MQGTGERGPTREVSVVVFGPGAEVWQRFGHIGLRFRIADERARSEGATSDVLDVMYDWGRFEFGGVGFFLDFASGRMRYWMEPDDARLAVDFYVRELDRTVSEYVLDLNEAEIDRLITIVQTQDNESNRFYDYDYFRDNCSTAIRDAIDDATEGLLKSRWAGDDAAKSYRDLMRQHLPVGAVNVLLTLGIDFVAGRPVDRSLDVWESAFVPMEFGRSLESLRRDDGTRLVRETRTLNLTSTASNLERDRPLELRTALLLVGIAGAGLLMASRRVRWLGGTLVVLWTTWCAFGAIMMLGFWTLTAHWPTRMNENLLLLSPLSLLMLVMMFRRSWRGGLPVIAMMVVVLSLVGLAMKLLPGAQVNGPLLGMTIPMHLATWFVVSRWSRRDGTSETRSMA